MKKMIATTMLFALLATGALVPSAVALEETPAPQGIHQSAAARATYIGKSKAKKIALAKAKGSKPRITEIELDKEHGVMVYEGEMVDSKYEYDFEINATTGKIIEWERERRD